MYVHLNILETCYQRSILLNSFYLKNNLLCHVNVNVALQLDDLFFAAKFLWLIRFSLNEIPSSGFDSSFTLLSIASSPYQVISRTNVHNSCKYTTMIHAQLFQRPFNNSKSIPSRWYCQCSLEYFHFKNPSSAGYSFVWGKNVRLTSTL